MKPKNPLELVAKNGIILKEGFEIPRKSIFTSLIWFDLNTKIPTPKEFINISEEVLSKRDKIRKLERSVKNARRKY